MGKRRSLWAVGWIMTERRRSPKPTPLIGSKIVSASSRAEAINVGTPDDFGAGEVFAEKMTVGYLDHFGSIDIKNRKTDEGE